MARVQYPAVAENFKGFFPNRSQTRVEEIGAAKSSQAH